MKADRSPICYIADNEAHIIPEERHRQGAGLMNAFDHGTEGDSHENGTSSAAIFLTL